MDPSTHTGLCPPMQVRLIYHFQCQECEINVWLLIPILDLRCWGNRLVSPPCPKCDCLCAAMAKEWMWCLGNTGSRSALTPKVIMPPRDEENILSVRSLIFLKSKCLLLLSGCAGRYIRSNLNMPSSLPSRAGGHRDYDKDCPITVFGSTQARLVGQLIFF